MQYKTFEFKRITKTARDYPHAVRLAYNSTEEEEEVWDVISGILIDGERYVHHIVSFKWKENLDYGFYQYPGYPALVSLGDLIYSLKVYYEVEK